MVRTVVYHLPLAAIKNIHSMDLFDTQKSHPDIFQQFSLEDTLFLYYSCPQRDKILHLYAKHTQFNFTISGKRIFHHGKNTWVSNPNKGLLVKKCAFLQELLLQQQLQHNNILLQKIPNNHKQH